MQKIYQKFVRFIGSSQFFWAIITIFLAETVWLAVTSKFQMAYDEVYHLGLIQYFGHHINPIVTHQDSSTYQFGALEQGTSLLYHYLMSFPYRLISWCTDSLVVQVIFLRLINVGLAVVNLIVARKLLRLLCIPSIVTNMVIFLFALTPVVTILSAQISYDNLLIPLTTLCTYLLVRFVQNLRQNKFDTKSLLALVATCFVNSLVKFAFLPIFFGIVLVVAYAVTTYARKPKVHLLSSVKEDFVQLRNWVKIPLIVLVVLSGGLFYRIYGVNVVRYQNPVPQCDQVLNAADCTHYYAWESNFEAASSAKEHPRPRSNLLVYDGYWLLLVITGSYGAVEPLTGTLYLPPIYLLGVLLLLTAAIGTTIVNFKKIIQSRAEVSILLILSFSYIVVLWARNYHDYLQLGVPQAVHGRYLVPVLLYVYVILGLGAWYVVHRGGQRVHRIGAIVAALTILLFITCGGFTQYVLGVDHSYGHLHASNNFFLTDAPYTNSGD